MAYSNGYDLTAVHTALSTRVGFRQPLSGSPVPTLTTPVTQSDGGRYYQDFHALVTVDNIKSMIDLPGASDANLITYLTNLKKAAIQRMLNGVFFEPQIIEQVKLYRRYGKDDTVIDNTGLFVGYEIDVADTIDAGVQLDSISLYLDSIKTFNVYLFKDGKITPEWTQSVTTVANQVTEQVLTDKVIGRGKYFIGYFQDDLVAAKAYREQIIDWDKTCYFKAKSITADATGATTFNRNEISYTGEPIGLNIEMSSFKDHTSQIKRKAAMFDELQGLIMAYMVIEQIIYNARSNGSERILKDQLDKVGIQIELNGVASISDSPQVIGLKQRIDRELQSVSKSFYPKPKAQIINRCYDYF
jgi:hypothetical protein